MRNQAEPIAFSGSASLPLDVTDTIDRIAGNPVERHGGGHGMAYHPGGELRLGRKAFITRHIRGLQLPRALGPGLGR